MHCACHAYLANSSKLVQKLQHICSGCTAYRLVGEFTNQRELIRWQDLLIEMDETSYSFGKAFEIEVETESPEQAKSML